LASVLVFIYASRNKDLITIIFLFLHEWIVAQSSFSTTISFIHHWTRCFDGSGDPRPWPNGRRISDQWRDVGPIWTVIHKTAMPGSTMTNYILSKHWTLRTFFKCAFKKINRSRYYARSEAVRSVLPLQEPCHL
jgi:hypothetical protein